MLKRLGFGVGMKSLNKLRIEAGLPKCAVSAKQLRKQSPGLANKWAKFTDSKKTEIKAAIVARVK